MSERSVVTLVGQATVLVVRYTVLKFAMLMSDDWIKSSCAVCDAKRLNMLAIRSEPPV